MLEISYKNVIESIFDKLNGLYKKEVNGAGSENIKISLTDKNEIVFNNSNTMKQIKLESASRHVFIIHVYDYYNQKSLIRHVISDDTKIKSWIRLFNDYENLIRSNKEIQKIKEVEKVVSNFFI